MLRRTVVFGLMALVAGTTYGAAARAAAEARAGETSAQARIENAMSAAPAAIARDATILDWPDMAGGQPKELRKGTNGWICYPSTPPGYEEATGEDPMCVDKEWQGWATAWMSKKPPQVKGTGIAYMLRGDRGASNTDPFATKPTPTNQWVHTGPHIMVLVPDPKLLEGIPTDPKTGGPYVMWKGTPYAHVMVPVH